MIVGCVAPSVATMKRGGVLHVDNGKKMKEYSLSCTWKRKPSMAFGTNQVGATMWGYGRGGGWLCALFFMGDLRSRARVRVCALLRSIARTLFVRALLCAGEAWMIMLREAVFACIRSSGRLGGFVYAYMQGWS